MEIQEVKMRSYTTQFKEEALRISDEKWIAKSV